MNKNMVLLKDAKIDQTSMSGQGTPAPVKAELTDFVIALINMTDKVMTQHRVKIGNGNWTNFFRGAPIPRTCTSNDPNTCFDQQAYKPVTSIDCGGASLSIEIRSDDGFGSIWDIDPDCAYAGGVITLMP